MNVNTLPLGCKRIWWWDAWWVSEGRTCAKSKGLCKLRLGCKSRLGGDDMGGYAVCHGRCFRD